MSDTVENLSFSLSPTSDPEIKSCEKHVTPVEEKAKPEDDPEAKSSTKTEQDLSKITEDQLDSKDNKETSLKTETENNSPKMNQVKARSLSPVSDKEVEVLTEIDIAEKRSQFRKDRQKRVEAFNSDLSTMVEALEKQKTIWIEDPDSHGDYEREWNKFWTKKSAELQTRGLDAKTFDMTPEWTLAWKSYFEQDLESRIQKERGILMRKHKLLSRDLVVDADFSKPPPGGLASPHHSVISSSSSLSLSDQEAGGKSPSGKVSAMSHRSGSQPSKNGRGEERCSSPWEEEDSSAKKQVKYSKFIFCTSHCFRINSCL